MFLVLLIAFTLQTRPATAGVWAKKGCDGYWSLKSDGYCYLAVAQPATYYQAQQLCERQDGQLTSALSPILKSIVRELNAGSDENSSWWVQQGRPSERVTLSNGLLGEKVILSSGAGNCNILRAETRDHHHYATLQQVPCSSASNFVCRKSPVKIISCPLVGKVDVSHLDDIFPSCADKYRPVLLLYRPGQPVINFTYPDYLDQIDQFKAGLDPAKWKALTQERVIFMVHGYRDTGTTGWIENAKTAIFSKENATVISIDWSLGAKSLFYLRPAANVRVVGMLAAMVTDKLVSDGVPQQNIWFIGHSLGVQVCAFAGKLNNHTYGRITGLDPAKPDFDSKPINYRLNKHFATQVDAIHTGGNKDDIPVINDLGTLIPVGNVDFYPNGGEDQPGCTEYDNIVKSCSHLRSRDLFIETIGSHQCIGGRIVNNVTCEKQTAQMGYQWDGTEGIFYMVTNAKPPFCQGKAGIRYTDPTDKGPPIC